MERGDARPPAAAGPGGARRRGRGAPPPGRGRAAAALAAALLAAALLAAAPGGADAAPAIGKLASVNGTQVEINITSTEPLVAGDPIIRYVRVHGTDIGDYEREDYADGRLTVIRFNATHPGLIGLSLERAMAASGASFRDPDPPTRVLDPSNTSPLPGHVQYAMVEFGLESARVLSDSLIELEMDWGVYRACFWDFDVDDPAHRGGLTLNGSEHAPGSPLVNLTSDGRFPTDRSVTVTAHGGTTRGLDEQLDPDCQRRVFGKEGVVSEPGRAPVRVHGRALGDSIRATDAAPPSLAASFSHDGLRAVISVASDEPLRAGSPRLGSLVAGGGEIDVAPGGPVSAALSEDGLLATFSFDAPGPGPVSFSGSAEDLAGNPGGFSGAGEIALPGGPGPAPAPVTPPDQPDLTAAASVDGRSVTVSVTAGGPAEFGAAEFSVHGIAVDPAAVSRELSGDAAATYSFEAPNPGEVRFTVAASPPGQPGAASDVSEGGDPADRTVRFGPVSARVESDSLISVLLDWEAGSAGPADGFELAAGREPHGGDFGARLPAPASAEADGARVLLRSDGAFPTDRPVRVGLPPGVLSAAGGVPLTDRGPVDAADAAPPALAASFSHEGLRALVNVTSDEPLRPGGAALAFLRAGGEEIDVAPGGPVSLGLSADGLSAAFAFDAPGPGPVSFSGSAEDLVGNPGAFSGAGEIAPDPPEGPDTTGPPQPPETPDPPEGPDTTGPPPPVQPPAPAAPELSAEAAVDGRSVTVSVTAGGPAEFGAAAFSVHGIAVDPAAVSRELSGGSAATYSFEAPNPGEVRFTVAASPPGQPGAASDVSEGGDPAGRTVRFGPVSARVESDSLISVLLDWEAASAGSAAGFELHAEAEPRGGDFSSPLPAPSSAEADGARVLLRSDGAFPTDRQVRVGLPQDVLSAAGSVPLTDRGPVDAADAGEECIELPEGASASAPGVRVEAAPGTLLCGIRDYGSGLPMDASSFGVRLPGQGGGPAGHPYLDGDGPWAEIGTPRRTYGSIDPPVRIEFDVPGMALPAASYAETAGPGEGVERRVRGGCGQQGGEPGGACSYADGGTLVVMAGHATVFGASPLRVIHGGGCTDCAAPTLGESAGGEMLVRGGFSLNGEAVDALRGHTPFEPRPAAVGRENVMRAVVYENYGPGHLRSVSFAFGVPGEGRWHDAEARAAVLLERQTSEVAAVEVDDPGGLLGGVSAESAPARCEPGGPPGECLAVSLRYSYRDAPLHPGVAVKPADYHGYALQFYFNHGVEVAGEPLRPPERAEISASHASHHPQKTGTLHLVQTDRAAGLWVDQHGIYWEMRGGSPRQATMPAPAPDRWEGWGAHGPGRHHPAFAALAAAEAGRAAAALGEALGGDVRNPMPEAGPEPPGRGPGPRESGESAALAAAEAERAALAAAALYGAPG